MKTSTSRINKEEQVKVVVRLKPDAGEGKHQRCVYLSDGNENELVVQSNNKKEIFIFDQIAAESTTQAEIYSMVGKEAVELGLQGFNYCFFAYGQTGAGKTFSVLGDANQITDDIYGENRGILPRLLQDLFNSLNVNNDETQHQIITCSYLQIYNEQIFDLLSGDKKIHNIRQDCKRGVFIQGLIEKKVQSYKQSIQLLLEGEKTRTMAATQMNVQSSRSHAIFTINIERQIVHQNTVVSRKSKINIIDLAGSERVKHTNVEGDRLKEGCSINKSLHVLGNVINSLLQSSKKKKHIPFRDSKLTHYLKDSLGGNSITKLLANVHCSKQYYGDTISTLMFAKRAKILKMKAEVNQKTIQNFDTLRKEVRKLREELAQTRYFKNEQRISQNTEAEDKTIQKNSTTSDFEIIIRNEPSLNIFEENQTNYKTLIDIYEDHMNSCLNLDGIKKNQAFKPISEWKNLEKKNSALTKLLANFPSFTKIYRQNRLLKQQINKLLANTARSFPSTAFQNKTSLMPTMARIQSINLEEFENIPIIDLYQSLITQMKMKFQQVVHVMEQCYSNLEQQNRQKEQKIKELKKKREYTPEIEDLMNENQYLKLNILELEDQIAEYQNHQTKIQIELKESKKNTTKIIESRQELKDSSEYEEFEIVNVLQTLKQIKASAQHQVIASQKQRQSMENLISQLRNKISLLMIQNSKLQRQSRSRHKRQMSYTKLMPSQQKPQIVTMKRSYLDVPHKNDPDPLSVSQKSITIVENQIKSIHMTYSKQISSLKIELKYRQKQLEHIQKELEAAINKEKQIQQEFGKNIQEIVSIYRLSLKTLALTKPKSGKNNQKFKESGELLTARHEKDNSILKKKLISPSDNRLMYKGEELVTRKTEPRNTKKYVSPK